MVEHVLFTNDNIIYF